MVTIFDAEDDIHPEIFNVINTVLLNEEVSVVQGGVQLMNYQSKWYSVLNVLEYFFWFKSRLHYHARLGMTPLGGNTVFFTRDVLQRVGGWDEQDLTEDADIGIRISLLGEQMRVIYDDRYVTREENGAEVPFTGVYQEVVPPERLVYTEIYDVAPFNLGDPAITTVTFREEAGRTTVTVRGVYPTKEIRDSVIGSSASDRSERR